MRKTPGKPAQLELNAALPLLEAGRHPTGLICPDCGGVMTVEVVGRQYLHLACRVGHSYSIEEFLADKESVFEAHLWRTVYLAEELGSLLEALEQQGRWRGNGDEAAARRRQLQEHVRTVRALIERDRPLVHGDQTAGPQWASP